MKMAKRIISMLLAMVMLVGMVPVTTVRAAENAEAGDGWGDWSDYVIESSVVTYAVPGGNLYFGHESYMDEGSMGYEIHLLRADSTITRADVPARVNGLVVTTIATSAFADCSVLTSLSLPGTITSIGDFPFLRCNSLTEIRMENPSMNYSTADGVLYHAYDTTQKDLCKYPSGRTQQEYIIEERTTSISAYAFENAKLTTVYIPESVTYIDSFAFTNCTYLTDVYYAGNASQWNNIRILGGNERLTNAQIHYNDEGYDTVGGFCGQNVIWELDINTGDMQISGEGRMAEYYYDETSVPWYIYKNQIRTLVVENGVTSVGASAFKGCSALREMTLADSCTDIGQGAFLDCTGLENIALGNGISLIADNAFMRCSSLRRIQIPASIRYIGNYAFSDCANMTEILVDEGSTEYESIDGILYYSAKKQLNHCPGGYSEKCAIANGTEIVYEYGFFNCTNIESLFIPASVKEIYGYAFYGCSGLTNIYYGGSEQDLANMLIESSGNEELQNANWFYNRTGLPEYHLEISPSENLSVGIGQSLQIICHLYNGDELVTEWEPPRVSASHTAGEAELSYGDWIEWGDGYLLMVTGEGSSSGTAALTLYHEDTGVTREIPIEVIAKCGENLTWALDANGILTIRGTGDMYDYSEENPAPWPLDIKAVVLKNGVTSIGEGAFCYSDLENISFGESLAKIGDTAFLGCDNLKYAAIASPLTEIGLMAFNGCMELISVSLPDTITQIGEFAFDQCTALQEAYYGGTEEQWDLVSVGDHNECLTRVINFEGLFGVVIDTELVNQDNTYANYKISATITNNSANLSLTNVFCAFDPGSSATITSGEGAQTESALAPQQSKNYTWTIQIDRSRYADGGVHYFTVTVDTDQTLTPSFRGAIALEAVNGQGNKLDFSKDVWNFHNFSEEKINPDAETSPLRPHKITEADKNALLAGLDASSRAIAESMLSEGSNGHCFGMALTTILSKMNVFHISDYENVNTLREASLTDRVWSIICYYQLLQNFDSYSGVRQNFRVSNSAREKLEILSEKADMVKTGGCPVMLDFGCEGGGGHSVVAYALEKGMWLYHGKMYNRRILTYDSNAANGGGALLNPIFNKECCLYFNEGTDEWIIPAYYPDTVSTNPKASIWCACNDLDILDIKNYSAEINNYSAELRLRNETAIQITSGGKQYVVMGKSGDISGDGELTSYYSTEVMSTEGNVGTRHIVLPDEAARYIVEPLSGSADDLDFYLLYDDKFVGITADAADSLSFSEDGEIVLTGNGSNFELTIADDNISAGAFNTYTVSGDAEGDIAVSVSEEGIAVNGDNLNGVTIEASEGDITDTVTITENTEEITLGRNGNDLVQEDPEEPAIVGSWTTDLTFAAADLGVSAPDSVIQATFTFNEDGTATTTWEAMDLTALRMYFHQMFVNAYYAMAYGAGITDLAEIEQFCMDSTGMSVSDYMSTIVTEEAMETAFTPASTTGSYRLNEAHTKLYTNMPIMNVSSNPNVANSFVIGNGTMYLNAASYGKPEYTFVCTRVG